MDHFPYTTHKDLTKNRRQPWASPISTEPSTDAHSHNGTNEPKKYERMEQIKLPTDLKLTTSLEESLESRKSSHETTPEKLSLEKLAAILNSLSNNTEGSRKYPSGGALYPIEAYLFAQRVQGISRGTYHYNPIEHVLEKLWETPEPLELFNKVNGWAEEARAVILFTGNWFKNGKKYGDFSYLLGLLETGHQGQNVLLAAASLGVPACPLAGFNDDRAADLLDLNQDFEQPIYTIALG